MASLLIFFRQQSVFSISFLCALISCFFNPPSKDYLSFMDWNTLAMLFSLMAAVAGYEESGIFKALADFLTSKAPSLRSLSAVLVALCFFSSMLITNDVALLTFVPFTLLLFSLQKSIKGWVCAYVVVLQTLAANTGSMLTPVGNPQNIFLAGKMGISIPSFMACILPYSAVSALVLLLALVLIPPTPLSLSSTPKKPLEKKVIFHASIYTLIFVLSLLAVASLISKLFLAVFVFIILLVTNPRLLKKIDYFLLLTFCAFFIFSGNLSSIPALSEYMKSAVSGNEFFSSLLVSQVISNVPATLLLFPFVSDVVQLLLGVNVGGLGTLVASLASLISFKLYTKSQGGGLFFLGLFTLANLILLFLLCILHYFL